MPLPLQHTHFPRQQSTLNRKFKIHKIYNNKQRGVSVFEANVSRSCSNMDERSLDRQTIAVIDCHAGKGVGAMLYRRRNADRFRLPVIVALGVFTATCTISDVSLATRGRLLPERASGGTRTVRTGWHDPR